MAKNISGPFPPIKWSSKATTPLPMSADLVFKSGDATHIGYIDLAIWIASHPVQFPKVELDKAVRVLRTARIHRLAESAVEWMAMQKKLEARASV